MALEGSLRDFGLADILQLIFFQRKTGVLTLEGRLDKIRLLFIEGNITGAESKRRAEANRLGKVLVIKGILSDKDLQAVLDEQKSSHIKLGNILIQKGLVTRDAIQEIVISQITETVVQIFGWKEGTYEFTPQAIPVDKDIPVSIDTQHLLMEGLRIVDELATVEGRITLDTVFTKKTTDLTGLSEEEKEIFLLVDGDNDVSTIIDITGKEEFPVSKVLVDLLEKGIIEQKEVLPVITEAFPSERKKTAIPYRFLMFPVIIVAFLLSFFSPFFDSGYALKRFLASEAIGDLRFKIEVFKFQHGSYPATLDLISEKPDPWGNQYIYVQTGDSFIVLSKGTDGKEKTPDDIF
jgi:predicted transcriptional regulator